MLDHPFAVRTWQVTLLLAWLRKLGFRNKCYHGALVPIAGLLVERVLAFVR